MRQLFLKTFQKQQFILTFTQQNAMVVEQYVAQLKTNNVLFNRTQANEYNPRSITNPSAKKQFQLTIVMSAVIDVRINIIIYAWSETGFTEFKDPENVLAIKALDSPFDIVSCGVGGAIYSNKT